MHRSLAFLIPGLVLGALRVPAQVAGVPTQPRFLVYSRGAIALDGGFGGLDVAGWNGPGSSVMGASASILFGPLIITPSGSLVLPGGGHSFGSYGGSIDLAEWIHVGVAHWDSAGTTHLHVPLGLAIPVAWCVKSDRSWMLWAGGRRDFQRVAPASQPSYGDDAWAYSIGLSVESRTSLGFQLAGDRTSRNNRDWRFSAGVNLAFRRLPSGTKTAFFSESSDFKSEHPCGSLPGMLAGH